MSGESTSAGGSNQPPPTPTDKILGNLAEVTRGGQDLKDEDAAARGLDAMTEGAKGGANLEEPLIAIAEQDVPLDQDTISPKEARDSFIDEIDQKDPNQVLAEVSASSAADFPQGLSFKIVEQEGKSTYVLQGATLEPFFAGAVAQAYRVLDSAGNRTQWILRVPKNVNTYTPLQDEAALLRNGRQKMLQEAGSEDASLAKHLPEMFLLPRKTSASYELPLNDGTTINPDTINLMPEYTPFAKFEVSFGEDNTPIIDKTDDTRSTAELILDEYKTARAWWRLTEFEEVSSPDRKTHDSMKDKDGNPVLVDWNVIRERTPGFIAGERRTAAINLFKNATKNAEFNGKGMIAEFKKLNEQLDPDKSQIAIEARQALERITKMYLLYSDPKKVAQSTGEDLASIRALTISESFYNTPTAEVLAVLDRVPIDNLITIYEPSAQSKTFDTPLKKITNELQALQPSDLLTGENPATLEIDISQIPFDTEIQNYDDWRKDSTVKIKLSQLKNEITQTKSTQITGHSADDVIVQSRVWLTHLEKYLVENNLPFNCNQEIKVYRDSSGLFYAKIEFLPKPPQALPNITRQEFTGALKLIGNFISNPEENLGPVEEDQASALEEAARALNQKFGTKVNVIKVGEKSAISWGMSEGDPDLKNAFLSLGVEQLAEELKPDLKNTESVKTLEFKLSGPTETRLAERLNARLPNLWKYEEVGGEKKLVYQGEHNPDIILKGLNAQERVSALRENIRTDRQIALFVLNELATASTNGDGVVTFNSDFPLYGLIRNNLEDLTLFFPQVGANFNDTQGTITLSIPRNYKNVQINSAPVDQQDSMKTERGRYKNFYDKFEYFSKDAPFAFSVKRNITRLKLAGITAKAQILEILNSNHPGKEAQIQQIYTLTTR